MRFAGRPCVRYILTFDSLSKVSCVMLVILSIICIIMFNVVFGFDFFDLGV